MSFKRWLSLSMAAMFLFFFAFCASAADYTIKVGTIQPESHPDCVLMREVFQKYVEDNSGGRIKVELYPMPRWAETGRWQKRFRLAFFKWLYQ